MKTILVTGGAGFIGSNFVRYMLKNYEDITLVNLDLLTYAGNLDNLAGVSDDKRYTFVRGDIHDGALVEQLFEKYGFDTVVNFAAESHVDRSITNPDIFMTTNVMGTLTLLDTAKRHWKLDPDDKYSRDFREGVKYLQVSTDEVYGALGATGMFTETTPLAPNSPYSASKASADMLVRGGATVLFSEITEVRDGVQLLAARCRDEETCRKLAREMDWYDRYLAEGGVDRDANPTPGNKKGGLGEINSKLPCWGLVAVGMGPVCH